MVGRRFEGNEGRERVYKKVVRGIGEGEGRREKKGRERQRERDKYRF